MRLLTRSPQGEGPQITLEIRVRLKIKHNCKIHTKSAAEHRSAHRSTNYISCIYTFKLEILSMGPFNNCTTVLNVRFTSERSTSSIWSSKYDFLTVSSSSIFIGTHGEICDIYISDSDTCHTMSHVTLHQAVKNGNMKSLMIK